MQGVGCFDMKKLGLADGRVGPSLVERVYYERYRP